MAKELGAREVSFLAVDVANPHAFGRTDGFGADLALRPPDLPVFEEVLASLERDCAADFRRGFIAESPQKLRRILEYFAAICGQGEYPKVRCNAPEFSAVIGATGRVQPCFFIEGPVDARVSSAGADSNDDLTRVLNRGDLSALRRTIRVGARRECKTCVCSMWRDPDGGRNSSLPVSIAR
jgi:Fe-coproporphyrin III synthase